MSVKAAVRQLRRLHDVGDADAVKPLSRNSAPATSMMRSRFSAAFCRLTLMAHLSYAAEPRYLTSYMTIVMNVQVIMVIVM